MPSSTSSNLKASAAAAFCARLLVHPLDNLRVSIHPSASVPKDLIPRLENLLTNVRRELQYQHRRYENLHNRNIRPPKNLLGQGIPIYRGLYKGVSFALVSQVPALAIFLSTYDATKHTLAQLAHSANLSVFNLYNVETHLLSGMTAKAAGTIVWAPMNRLQGLATHPTTGQAPLTLKEACQLAKHICRSEGVSGLWSGYFKSYSTLLPYTTIYFATYEQLKLLARWIVSRENLFHRLDSDNWKSWALLQEYYSDWKQQKHATTSTALTLDTYMVCVASSVIVSSAICHTASSVRSVLWNRHQLTSNLTEGLRRQPMTPATYLPSNSFRYPLVFPAQFKTLISSSSTIANQTLMGFPWQQSQYAALTTATSLLPTHHSPGHHQLSKAISSRQPMTHHPLSPTSTISRQYQAGQPYKVGQLMSTLTNSIPTSLNDHERVATRAPGLFRTIARGLGPRILWTMPGVTLTTAGFELLRSMTLGP